MFVLSVTRALLLGFGIIYLFLADLYVVVYWKGALYHSTWVGISSYHILWCVFSSNFTAVLWFPHSGCCAYIGSLLAPDLLLARRHIFNRRYWEGNLDVFLHVYWILKSWNEAQRSKGKALWVLTVVSL